MLPKLNSRTLLLALAFSLVIAGCGGDIDGESRIIGELVIVDQEVEAVNAVNASVINLEGGAGWVAVYSAEGAGEGSLLGRTAVGEGRTLNAEIVLDRDVVDGETLYAALHVDRGEEGVFEPSGKDKVAEDATGERQERPFVVSINVDGIEPAITVADQSYDSDDDPDSFNDIEIEEVAVNAPTWIAIFEGDGNGAVIGTRLLQPGTRRNVDMELSRDVVNGETLFARLHMEAGSQGSFEYPGADEPLAPEVSGSFTIRINQIVPDPELTIEDQVAAPANQLIVANARVTADGHVVIYEDDGSGGRGAVLGSTALTLGSADNIIVTLNRDLLDGETIHGRLHDDDGNGMFDEGTDGPQLNSNGNEVTDDAVVSVMNIVNSVTQADATLNDLSSVIIVDTVSSNGPGVIVITDDNGGMPGTALGGTAVSAGDTTAVEVHLSRPAADGETLHAQLYVDGGMIGTWEPGTDTAAMEMGAIVFDAFVTTVPATTPAMRFEASAMGNADYLFSNAFPPTMPSPIGSMNGDPVLTFNEGWRYEIVNTVSAGHPFDFISEGAVQPDDDVIQAAESNDGAIEGDMSVGWSAGSGVIQFTVSPAFTAAVTRYRCRIHRTDMRGSVQYAMP